MSEGGLLGRNPSSLETGRSCGVAQASMVRRFERWFRRLRM
jgi:hypothetical protein